MNSGELLDQFRSFLRREAPRGQYSSDTERTYLGQTKSFLEWCDERELRVRTVTHDQALAYRDDLSKKGYANNTIMGHINSVRQFFNMLQLEEDRRDNPFSKVRSPRDLRDPDQRVIWLDLSDVRRLLAAPSHRTMIGIRDRAILGLMGYHGLRRCEIVNLKMNDLDMEARLIDLVGKGGKRRRIYLVNGSANRLEDWLDVRSQIAAQEETTVFVATHGGGNGGPGHGMSRRSINRLVDRHLEDLGLKREGVSTMALRHTYTTETLAAGAQVHVVAKQLGHDDLATLLGYAHITEPSEQNPSRFIEDRLRSQRKREG